MVVLFNAVCLSPLITQVARKDVGEMKPRRQIRDRLGSLSRAWNESYAEAPIQLLVVSALALPKFYNLQLKTRYG